jgi:hypothetical protein
MEFCGLYSIMSLWMKWTKEYTIQQINYYPLGTTAVTIATTCLFALCEWSQPHCLNRRSNRRISRAPYTSSLRPSMLSVGSPTRRLILFCPRCTMNHSDAAHATGTDYTKSRWWVNLVMPVCGECSPRFTPTCSPPLSGGMAAGVSAIMLLGEYGFVILLSILMGVHLLGSSTYCTLCSVLCALHNVQRD